MEKLKYEENESLSKFLEKILPQIYENKVESLAIVAKTENSDYGTAYFNCSFSTKLLFSGYIQQDATLDNLINNGILFAVDDDEDEDKYDDDNPDNDEQSG